MKEFTEQVETSAQHPNRQETFLRESLEAYLPVLKAKGSEIVVLYRKDPDLAFYDDYKNLYDSLQMRRNWQKKGYVIVKVWDLDHPEGMSERERNRVRPRNRSSIG